MWRYRSSLRPLQLPIGLKVHIAGPEQADQTNDPGTNGDTGAQGQRGKTGGDTIVIVPPAQPER